MSFAFGPVRRRFVRRRMTPVCFFHGLKTAAVDPPSAVRARLWVTSEQAASRIAAALEIFLIRRYVERMTKGAQITIHFTCRDCSKFYSAKQKPLAERGRFECLDCQKPVYEWAGPYSFTDWKPL
jgi:hypothetical protein